MITTQIIKLNQKEPSGEAIERAALIICEGGLVAFPTETVYGLGADAGNEAAVCRIFNAKGRPADNPIIVHVASHEMLDRVAERVPRKAVQLIERFWPGPLTLVLQRSSTVAGSVSAGLATVAVRMPNCKIALELIRAAGTPIAAPSANVSGRPSPTHAEHVAADLGGKIEMILDGGETDIGIESTVIDMTTEPPAILRPGWITREAISDVIGPIAKSGAADTLQRSPGTRHRHYSPRARVVLVESGGASKSVAQVCSQHLLSGPVGFIGHTAVSIPDQRFTATILEAGAEAYAHSLYSALRDLDARNPTVIVIEGIDDSNEGSAVMDRLRRAAAEIIE